MNIEERVNIAKLIKYYGTLLTDKQREVVEMYVDNNLSFAEVSEILSISRQAVKYTLDNAFKSLENYENKLKFIARDDKLKKLLNSYENKNVNDKIIKILEDN